MSEATDFPARLVARLSRYPARRVDAPASTTRAAVLLLLRAGEREAEALFVIRATHDGDPWSGHVALPGGREEPGDPDLVGTALRELQEETGLLLGKDEVVGRLDELHPVSRHVPPIAISPFVAWRPGAGGVGHSAEIDGHFWAPVSALGSQARRSSLELRRDGELYRFPTIEYGDHTVWGLTYSIVQNFVQVIGEEDRPEGAP